MGGHVKWIFLMNAKTNYDKGHFAWTTELSTTTKITTISTFDFLVKLHFLSKDTIHNFSCHMFPLFIITTIAFVVIRVCGEIDSKFQLLVVEKSSPKKFKLYFFENKDFENLFFWYFPTWTYNAFVLLHCFVLSSMIW